MLSFELIRQLIQQFNRAKHGFKELREELFFLGDASREVFNT